MKDTSGKEMAKAGKEMDGGYEKLAKDLSAEWTKFHKIQDKWADHVPALKPDFISRKDKQLKGLWGLHYDTEVLDALKKEESAGPQSLILAAGRIHGEFVAKQQKGEVAPADMNSRLWSELQNAAKKNAKQ